MDRRAFFARGTAAVAGVLLSLRTAQAKETVQPIGYICDSYPKRWEIHGEYFFAHSQEQEDELYEAIRSAARGGEPLYWHPDEYLPPDYGRRGIVVFPDHGGSADQPYVKFCYVVLLPRTLFHPAFEEIRRKAEKW